MPTGHGSVMDTIENENSWKWMFENKPDNSTRKEELIQQATTRLRRRLLQEGTGDVISEITRLQNQLEMLRMEAVTTVDLVAKIGEDNTQYEPLDEIERRLDTHRTQLAQLKVAPLANGVLTTSDSSTTAVTSSSFSSSRTLLSSLFSQPQPSVVSADDYSEATSITNNQCTDLGHTDEDQLKDRRRRRVKCHRQRYQDRPAREVDNVVSSHHGWPQPITRHQPMSYSRSHEKTATRDVALYNMSETKAHKHPARPSTTVRQQQAHTVEEQAMDCSLVFSPSEFPHPIHQRINTPHHPLSPLDIAFEETDIAFPSPGSISGHTEDEYDSPLDELAIDPWLSDQEFRHRQSYPASEADSWLRFRKNIPSPVHLPERTVLDDALSFLDGLSSGEDDGGFSEDMYFLLGRPDLCCRPLSEIREAMSEHRRMESNRSWLSKAIGNGLKSIIYTGYRWCRFLSILGLAIFVSLLRGPEEFLAETQDEEDE
ncbi:hypothetical protein DFQ28_003130 [Apophysomyces sp. BC1034]|nr:hypothetical protein DFQ30_003275 [Apophysomyces sp. BC1015]KAG0178115.1 hypothetical protein DFQ29_003931 [Apophysomyces sp. BC1021]KAG0189650.1 hypothetical protein DFQ28_003130 [Apophysomyces sp. BC1034]